jgi:hypothetical protein
MEMILSITVGILSIIVMLLIGWQIYTLMDINKFRNEIELKRQHIIRESERNMCTSAASLADFYYSLLIKESIKDKEFKYLNYRILSLLHASRLDDFATCNAIVRALLESITDELLISKRDRELLINTLLQIKNPKNIENFETLLKMILNLRIRDKS